MADLERHKRLSKDDRDALGAKLEKAYAAGRSLAELGEEHGTSAGRVRLILLERGVTLRSRGGAVRKPDPARGERAKELAKEYGAGASLQELAAQARHQRHDGALARADRRRHPARPRRTTGRRHQLGPLSGCPGAS